MSASWMCAQHVNASFIYFSLEYKKYSSITSTAIYWHQMKRISLLCPIQAQRRNCPNIPEFLFVGDCSWLKRLANNTSLGYSNVPFASLVKACNSLQPHWKDRQNAWQEESTCRQRNIKSSWLHVKHDADRLSACRRRKTGQTAVGIDDCTILIRLYCMLLSSIHI